MRMVEKYVSIGHNQDDGIDTSSFFLFQSRERKRWRFTGGIVDLLFPSSSHLISFFSLQSDKNREALKDRRIVLYLLFPFFL